ncbi:hypothetical protein BMS3Abin08_00675 [bacterium BMS3Abin08]|nr:hypothetical protein BMS3Abin08_00675 [bacterium BMS3Abin08]
MQDKPQRHPEGFRDTEQPIEDNKVVVELKCVDKITPVHEAQLLTYLESVYKIGQFSFLRHSGLSGIVL